MKTTALGIWGLMMLGSAACSDRGTVVGDMTGNAGSSGAGDGEHATGGADAATGGKPSGTGGQQESTGGTDAGDGGSSATGGRSQGTGGATGGSTADTGGTGTGGRIHSGGANTGGRATGGAGGNEGGAGGKTGGTGGSGEGTGGSGGSTGGSEGGAAGAAGAAGSTTCTTDACCASVELVQDSLTVYLIDGQFYFDGVVNLVDGPLDLYTWLATVELSSEQTGVVEGPMARSQGRDSRTYWAGSTGSPGSGIECGDTLTLQARVRTDTKLSNSATGCAGVYGPPVTIQATVQCVTCPEDAAADVANTEPCVYPVTLECIGIITDNEGDLLSIGCPCQSVLDAQPRHWLCPRV